MTKVTPSSNSSLLAEGIDCKHVVKQLIEQLVFALTFEIEAKKVLENLRRPIYAEINVDAAGHLAFLQKPAICRQSSRSM